MVFGFVVIINLAGGHPETLYGVVGYRYEIEIRVISPYRTGTTVPYYKRQQQQQQTTSHSIEKYPEE